MANGWESKSVLEQQIASDSPLTEEEKERISREKALYMREVQTLQLSCARVREQMQRSQSPRYNELLERELNHLQTELARLH
jgi:hypothetical protein